MSNFQAVPVFLTTTGNVLNETPGWFGGHIMQLDDLPLDVLLLVCGYELQKGTIAPDGRLLWDSCLCPLDVPPPPTAVPPRDMNRPFIHLFAVNQDAKNQYKRKRSFQMLLRPLCYTSSKARAVLRPTLMDQARQESAYKMRKFSDLCHEDHKKSNDIGHLWCFFDQVATYASSRGLPAVRVHYNRCIQFFKETSRGSMLPNNVDTVPESFTLAEFGGEDDDTDSTLSL